MRKLLIAALGLGAFALAWKKEEEADGLLVALSPFLAAFAIELAIEKLQQRQARPLRIGSR
jgi:hypothetical protein